jgi:hypothetical protein
MSKKNILVTIVLAVAILATVVIAWELRWRAVDELPIDYDEDDYILAAQEYADLIRTGNWLGFTQTNYRPEHPPLAKIIFGLSILPLPKNNSCRMNRRLPDPTSISHATYCTMPGRFQQSSERLRYCSSQYSTH